MSNKRWHPVNSPFWILWEIFSRWLQSTVWRMLESRRYSIEFFNNAFLPPFTVYVIHNPESFNGHALQWEFHWTKCEQTSLSKWLDASRTRRQTSTAWMQHHTASSRQYRNTSLRRDWCTNCFFRWIFLRSNRRFISTQIAIAERDRITGEDMGDSNTA